jgi:hypothetical protein
VRQKHLGRKFKEKEKTEKKKPRRGEKISLIEEEDEKI